jgi:aspartate kinase
MCLVCVVGRGIGSTHGTSGKIFTAVGRAGVNVEMISVGASDIALNFVVKSQDRDACIRAIHSEFLWERHAPEKP